MPFNPQKDGTLGRRHLRQGIALDQLLELILYLGLVLLCKTLGFSAEEGDAAQLLHDLELRSLSLEARRLEADGNLSLSTLFTFLGLDLVRRAIRRSQQHHELLNLLDGQETRIDVVEHCNRTLVAGDTFRCLTPSGLLGLAFQLGLHLTDSRKAVEVLLHSSLGILLVEDGRHAVDERLHNILWVTPVFLGFGQPRRADLGSATGDSHELLDLTTGEGVGLPLCHAVVDELHRLFEELVDGGGL